MGFFPHVSGLEKFCRNLGTFLRLAPSTLLSVSNWQQDDKQTHCIRTRQEMSKSSADQSALSPHRAFVVQLREQADVEQGLWLGRIEHVTSGRAMRFQSLEEMVTFITAVLASLTRSAPDE
jgi:hypothetical protein